MKRLIPASYIFSYWIFVWSVVYILSVWGGVLRDKMQWFNPTFALLIALIWTTESLVRLYLQGSSWKILVKYASTILAIKVLPLFFIYKLGMPFGWNIHTLRDLGVMFGMFVIYAIYLYINGTTYEAVYSDLTESIDKDENRTPFEGIVNRIFGI